MLPAFTKLVHLEWEGVPGLEDTLPLLRLERNEFSAVLGQETQIIQGQISGQSPRNDHLWRVAIDPETTQAQLHADLSGHRLTSIIPSMAQFGDSLNLLHSLAHSEGSTLNYSEVETYDDVVERIYDEVANVYPYFTLRGLDWEKISARYEGIQTQSDERFWAAAQRWVAELGDGHTSIRKWGSRHHPPYLAEMRENGALLQKVPEFSAAYQAGVRPGSVIRVQDPMRWVAQTGASPQHQRMIAARRFMEMRSQGRSFEAVGPEGQRLTWEEQVQRPAPSVTADGPRIRISRFDSRTPALLAEELAKRRATSTLTIDLRGNTGGSLTAADLSRRLLIRETGEYGSIRYCDGQGGLSALYPVCLESEDIGFRGCLRVMVDAMTYSAAEDFLQPLAGLPWVQVQGGPTGGGSGRPHTVPLKDGYTLSISTAITYTADEQPVEYRGIR